MRTEAPHDRRTDTRTSPGSWLTPLDDRASAVSLLEADHGLAARVPRAQRDEVSALLRVRVETLEPGPWAPETATCDPDTFGLLVLDGLLFRDACVEQRHCGELLGAGDLLRPWVTEDDLSVPCESTWRVLETTQLAVLDRRATAVLGHVPALTAELLDRGVSRARALQFQLSLTQVSGIPARLHLLLWHLADRWGRVTLDGVVVPLRLTHEQLGLLIGARRPSVTTALRRLESAGAVVRRRGGGWLLRGEPDQLADDHVAAVA